MQARNQRVHIGRLALVVAAGIALFSLWLVLMQTPSIQAQRPPVVGPFVGPVIHPKSFDGDLRQLPKTPPNTRPRIIPLRGRGQAVQSSSPNRILAPTAPSRRANFNMPAPAQNFDGIYTLLAWPPDTNGDVGLNHYIQAVNDSFGVFTKTGTILFGPTSFNALWAGALTGTPCDAQHESDPIVLYDQLADRWLLSDLAFAVNPLTLEPQPPFYECFAVSKTSDPVSGGWYLYAFLADNSLLNDYPKIGLWPDAYYMTANMYDLTTNDVFVRVWALDRNAMLSGGALNQVHFDLPTCYAASDPTCPFFSLLPGNLRGTAPPGGSPNYLANIETANLSSTLPFSSSVIHLWKFNVNWSTPLSSTFTGPMNLTVSNFTEPLIASAGKIAMNMVPQTRTTTLLDTLGDRLMMQAQYRNLPTAGTQSLWLSHSVISGTVTAIRWYEIHISGGSFSLFQQGTFDPGDGNYRWMPSLAVDGNGNMAVGYSVSSGSISPGIRYAGRLRTDPANELSQGEATLINGTGSQTNFIFLEISRWGDYTAMTIDPADDCTFWYTNEYYTADGVIWQTRIGSFKMPSCTTPQPTPTPNRLYLPLILKDQ